MKPLHHCVVGKLQIQIFFSLSFSNILGTKSRKLLLTFFNHCWHSGIPDAWRKVIVIPILKNNEPGNQFNSYGLISLINVLEKPWNGRLLQG